MALGKAELVSRPEKESNFNTTLNMNNYKLKFQHDGYLIYHSKSFKELILDLKSLFENEFQSRFGSDQLTNRNLIKRFADSIELASLFATSELSEILHTLGLRNPLYCGPVASHYTHTDMTWNSFGLPWHQD